MQKRDGEHKRDVLTSSWERSPKKREIITKNTSLNDVLSLAANVRSKECGV